MDKMKSNSQSTLLLMAIRILVLAMLIDCLAFAPGSVRAQNPVVPTEIVIGAPAQSTLGGPLTVQAVLADSQGHPISKAVIYFTTQSTFLGETKEVVLAQAVTNADGQAVTEFADNSSGSLTLSAEFRGDTQYAPSNATARTATTGAGQVYVEHVGVDIPGYNVPPMGVQSATLRSSQQDLSRFIQDLWPAMTGWPIAAILLLVWSMYLFAVKFVFRVAGVGTEHRNSNDPMRLP
jgi:hypothetical protein